MAGNLFILRSCHNDEWSQKQSWFTAEVAGGFLRRASPKERRSNSIVCGWVTKSRGVCAGRFYASGVRELHLSSVWNYYQTPNLPTYFFFFLVANYWFTSEIRKKYPLEIYATCAYFFIWEKKVNYFKSWK